MAKSTKKSVAENQITEFLGGLIAALFYYITNGSILLKSYGVIVNVPSTNVMS